MGVARVQRSTQNRIAGCLALYSALQVACTNGGAQHNASSKLGVGSLATCKERETARGSRRISVTAFAEESNPISLTWLGISIATIVISVLPLIIAALVHLAGWR